MAGRKSTFWLGLLLLLVLGISLAYAYGFRIAPLVDARWYDTIAWNLAQGKGFRLTDDAPLAKDPAIAVVGPGYPYFLAGIYALFGHHLEPVWIIQSFLHALNTLLVFLLARKIFSDSPNREGYSLFAAALYGFNPDLVQIAAMLFTETLYLTVILSAALGMAAWIERPEAKIAMGTAAVLGIAILVRPIAVLPLACFFVLLGIKKKWLSLTASAAIVAVLIGVWTVRNYTVYNQVVVLTAAGGYDLWVGNNPNSAGEQLVEPEIDDYKATHDPLETDRHGAEEYWKFIVSDPAGFLKLQAVKTAKFFSALRTSAWWFHLSGVARTLTFLVSAPFYILYLVLGGAGVISALRRGPGMARVAAFLALSVPAVVIPITVTSRMRYPMYPFLAILSALAVLRYKQNGIPRRWFLVSAGVVVLATAADFFVSLPQIPARIMELF
jgi:hypothetical protein